jgi:hypothetical protein
MGRMFLQVMAFGLITLVLGFAGCAEESPTPTETPTATATPELTPTPTRSPVPTATLVPGIGDTVLSDSIEVTLHQACLKHEQDENLVYVVVTVKNTGELALDDVVAYVVAGSEELVITAVCEGTLIFPRVTCTDHVLLRYVPGPSFRADQEIPLIVLSEDPTGQSSIVEFTLPSIQAMPWCGTVQLTPPFP